MPTSRASKLGWSGGSKPRLTNHPPNPIRAIIAPLPADCRPFASGWPNASHDRGRGRDMRGLLADVNVQGHLPYLRRLLEILDLWPVLAALPVEFATFPDLQLRPNLDDRSVWNHCQ